ncbi:MAG TPA: PASTA domain-containing protein [Solirubrobacterales bacterium]|nr:PASTA domain-containing protein [Solirubrobacterales bacterium]
MDLSGNGWKKETAVGRGAMRFPGAVALVLLLALACVPSASAAPLSMTFTEARANVGVQLSDAALFEAPDVAPLAAQIEPGTGAITAGALSVPQFSTDITEPIEATVTVDFDIGTISGSFDQATGALSLSGEAGGTLTALGGDYDGEECDVLVPEILTLTTAANSGGDDPRPGVPFTAGLAGPGAIAGTWDHMDAIPVSADPDNVSFCENVENRIGGDGGIWLEQKGAVVPPVTSQPPVTNPPPPPAALCVVPKLAGKTLKAAKRKIRAANCKLGKIRRAKRPRGLKGPWLLVVKSQSPESGSSPANGRVHLRLGPKS